MVTTSLIYRKMKGMLSEEEERVFEEWLREDEAHVLYYERLRGVFDGEMDGEGCSAEELDHAWMEFERFTREFRVRRRRRIVARWTRVAAVVVFIVCVGLVWFLNDYMRHEESDRELVSIGNGKVAVLELANGSQVFLRDGVDTLREESGERIVVTGRQISYKEGKVADSISYNRLRVPRGCEYQLSLGDGTVVWVNSDSYLEYPVSFGEDKREVLLRGEAYFEVKRDTTRPFVVRTGNQRITVLGTSFGVTAYGEDSQEYTTLVSGRVRVDFQDRKEGIVLEPGTQVVRDKVNGEVLKRKVNVAEFVAWKDGKYVFYRKRLEDILNILSRWYDFEVFYVNDSAKDIVLSGEMERFDDFNQVLHLMEQASDVRFVVKDKTVLVNSVSK